MGGAGRRFGVGALLALALTVPALPLGAVTYPQYVLRATLDGEGSGSLETTDANGVPDGRIDCVSVNGVIAAGSVCSHTYTDFLFSGIPIWYTVPAAVGSCVGSTCNTGIGPFGFKLTNDDNLEYTFYLRNFEVVVSKSGAGTGTVVSVPDGINCGPPTGCNYAFPFGTSVTLYAGPDASSYFQGWTGACAGQGPGCVLMIPASPTSANAVFGSGLPPTQVPSTAPTAAPLQTPGHTATPPTATAPPDASPSAPAATAPSAGPGSSDAGASTSPPPVGPAGTSSATDLMPIALAILGALAIIVLGFGVGVYLRRPRSAP